MEIENGRNASFFCVVENVETSETAAKKRKIDKLQVGRDQTFRMNIFLSCQFSEALKTLVRVFALIHLLICCLFSGTKQGKINKNPVKSVLQVMMANKRLNVIKLV